MRTALTVVLAWPLPGPTGTPAAAGEFVHNMSSGSGMPLAPSDSVDKTSDTTGPSSGVSDASPRTTQGTDASKTPGADDLNSHMQLIKAKLRIAKASETRQAGFLLGLGDDIMTAKSLIQTAPEGERTALLTQLTMLWQRQEAAHRELDRASVEAADLEHNLRQVQGALQRLRVQEHVDTAAPSITTAIAVQCGSQALSDTVSNGVSDGPCCFFTPTFDPSPGGRVFAAFGVRPAAPPPVSEGPRQWKVVDKVCGLAADGSPVAEIKIKKDARVPQSNSKPVADRMSEVYTSSLPDNVKPLPKQTLRQLGCPHAFCGTQDYRPDLVLVTFVKDIPAVLSVVEFKSSACTVYSGLSQVTKYAGAAAVGLCARGVSFRDVLVPAICTNGLSEQHVAVYLATPSLPVPVVVSPVLDLLTDEGTAAAHHFRHKAMAVVAEAAKRVAACEHTPVYSAFIRQLHPRASSKDFQIMRCDHVTLPNTLFVKAPALTAYTIKDDFTASLTYMYHVLARVQVHERAKHLACYPVCFVKGLINARSSSGLIFPRLTLDGFNDGGLPTERRIVELYLDALRLAIDALHAAGVVHGDLYPSNIMWKYDADEEAVRIVFIDWDSAFVAADGVPDAWRARWTCKTKWRLVESMQRQGASQLDVCHALDTFFLNVLEHYGDGDARRWDKWEVMAPGAGSNIAFREFAWTYACEAGLARKGDPCCDVHRRAAV